MIQGTGFLLNDDGEQRAGGFYRNVYVLAVDTSSAIERAKAQVLETLRTGDYDASMHSMTEQNLAIEDVDESWAYWKLLRPEGHVFYIDDDTDADDDPPGRKQG